MKRSEHIAEAVGVGSLLKRGQLARDHVHLGAQLGRLLEQRLVLELARLGDGAQLGVQLLSYLAHVRLRELRHEREQARLRLARRLNVAELLQILELESLRLALGRALVEQVANLQHEREQHR